MSTDQNKAIVYRLYEEINKGNIAIFDELTTPDGVEHAQRPPGFAAGREGTKQLFMMLRSAFPDFSIKVEDTVSEGDKVVNRVTLRGTHKGAFMGVPPTGKHVTWGAIDIVRFANGKAIEHWGLIDNLGVMQQLGVVPPPRNGS